MKKSRGYTLIELMVAVGLFALIMTLVSGAYLLMISLTRQAQGMATGIDNLSFALETMTRTIRTGAYYNNSVDCLSGCTSFSVIDSNNNTVTYALNPNNSIIQTIVSASGVAFQNNVPLTDPSVSVSTLIFYVSGTNKPPGDYNQPHVTITISGTVSYGPNRTQPFTVETGATMRGIDI